MKISSLGAEVTLVTTKLLCTALLAFFPCPMLPLHVICQQLHPRTCIVALVALVGLEVEVNGVDVVGEVGLDSNSIEFKK